MKFNQVTWYSKLLALILFVALPFLGFYAGMKYQQPTTPPSQDSSINDTKPGDSDQTGWKTIVNSSQITVKTKYENETLKYSGIAQLPSPCHQLKDQSGVMESYPEQVRIQLEKAVVSVFLNGEKIK